MEKNGGNEERDGGKLAPDTPQGLVPEVLLRNLPGCESGYGGIWSSEILPGVQSKHTGPKGKVPRV